MRVLEATSLAPLFRNTYFFSSDGKFFYKRFVAADVEFGRRLWRECPRLRPYLLECRGVCALASASGCEALEMVHLTSDTVEESPNLYSCYDNLFPGSSPPRFIDLKLGFRTHDLGASQTKTLSQMRKALASTTREHGVRLMAASFYTPEGACDRLYTIGKYAARELSFGQLRDLVRAFISGGVAEPDCAAECCTALRRDISAIQEALAGAARSSAPFLFGPSLLLYRDTCGTVSVKLVDFSHSCFLPLQARSAGQAAASSGGVPGTLSADALHGLYSDPLFPARFPFAYDVGAERALASVLGILSGGGLARAAT